MSLQAKFTAGVDEITVHGLHQWDYGRKLEIQSASLAGRSVVEVHFAAEGMTEAVVRTCTVNSQTTTAAIPDVCLEQNSPIFAWVFCLDQTEGFTVLKITMPISARTKPAGTSTEAPTEYTGKYNELITAVNDIIKNTYTKSQIEAALGVYITEIDALVGGGA